MIHSGHFVLIESSCIYKSASNGQSSVSLQHLTVNCQTPIASLTSVKKKRGFVLQLAVWQVIGHLQLAVRPTKSQPQLTKPEKSVTRNVNMCSQWGLTVSCTFVTELSHFTAQLSQFHPIDLTIETKVFRGLFLGCLGSN